MYLTTKASLSGVWLYVSLEDLEKKNRIVIRYMTNLSALTIHFY